MYVSTWLPVVVYGAFGIAAAVLDFFLPETKGSEIGETLDDALKFLQYVLRRQNLQK